MLIGLMTSFENESQGIYENMPQVLHGDRGEGLASIWHRLQRRGEAGSLLCQGQSAIFFSGPVF